MIVFLLAPIITVVVVLLTNVWRAQAKTVTLVTSQYWEVLSYGRNIYATVTSPLLVNWVEKVFTYILGRLQTPWTGHDNYLINKKAGMHVAK